MKYTIPIMGMHCASCATLIARQLKKTEGITQADVNYASEEAVVETTNTNGIQNAKKAIDALGYKAILTDDLADSEEQKETLQKQETREMKKKVLVTGFFTLLVIILTLPDMLGLPLVPPSAKEPIIYITTLLATIVQFYGGWNFYRGALSAIQVGATNMDTLIVLGTSIAYGYSVFHLTMTLLGRAQNLPKAMFYDSSTVIIALVLLGKYLELKGKRTATESLRALSALETTTAHKVTNDGIMDVSTTTLQVHDIIEIRPGERIPIDGVIEEGMSAIDQSVITGEPIPVEKSAGDELIAGTMNTTGVLRVQTTAIGKNTVLAHIQQLVHDAQNAKPDIARLTDTIASYFVPTVIVIGILTAVVWLIVGSPIDAIGKSIAVFVVACPCALGLATPMAVIGGVGRSAKSGVLVRSARTLERAGSITAIVFDKTGTVTKGKPSVTDVNITNRTVLPEIIAVEQASEHPLSGAILAWATQQKMKSTGMTPKNIQAHPGLGITGTVEKLTITIGSEQFLKQKHIPITKKQQTYADGLIQQGKTVIFGAVGKTVAVVFAIDDELRPEATHVIQSLHTMGMNTVLLSGDKKSSAEKKARQIGIPTVIAEVKPDQKAAVIEQIKRDNRVMMVGDGINDAPAIAAADVGVAIGSGTAIAKATADMTILANSLDRIPLMITVSRHVMRTIKQNLWWAFGYNILLIPIAAGVGSSIGLTLTPPMAAFAMAASSLSVVLNSSRLSRIKNSYAMA